MGRSFRLVSSVAGRACLFALLAAIHLPRMACIRAHFFSLLSSVKSMLAISSCCLSIRVLCKATAGRMMYSTKSSMKPLPAIQKAAIQGSFPLFPYGMTINEMSGTSPWPLPSPQIRNAAAAHSRWSCSSFDMSSCIWTAPLANNLQRKR